MRGKKPKPVSSTRLLLWGVHGRKGPNPKPLRIPRPTLPLILVTTTSKPLPYKIFLSRIFKVSPLGRLLRERTGLTKRSESGNAFHS